MLHERPRLRATLVEGATIVGSILLAFALQAEWEKTRDRNDEAAALAPLIAEIDLNLERVEVDLRIFRAIRADAERLLSWNGRAPASLDPDSVDILLESMTWWGGGSQWMRGALDALVTGGNLEAVEDRALRATLSRLTQVYAQTVEAQEVDDEWVRGTLMPWIRTRMNLHQISARSDNRAGSDEPQVTEPFPWTGPDSEHRGLVLSREFQNLMLEKWWIADDAVNQLARLREELVHVRAAICSAHASLEECGPSARSSAP